VTKKRRDKKSQSCESLEVASSLTVSEHSVLFVANEGHVTTDNNDHINFREHKHDNISNDINTNAAKDNHGRPATSGGLVASSTVAQTAQNTSRQQTAFSVM